MVDWAELEFMVLRVLMVLIRATRAQMAEPADLAARVGLVARAVQEVLAAV